MGGIFNLSKNAFFKNIFIRIVKAQVIVEGGIFSPFGCKETCSPCTYPTAPVLHVCSEVVIAHAQEQYASCIQSKTTMHLMLT